MRSPGAFLASLLRLIARVVGAVPAHTENFGEVGILRRRQNERMRDEEIAGEVIGFPFDVWLSLFVAESDMTQLVSAGKTRPVEVRTAGVIDDKTSVCVIRGADMKRIA